MEEGDQRKQSILNLKLSPGDTPLPTAFSAKRQALPRHSWESSSHRAVQLQGWDKHMPVYDKQCERDGSMTAVRRGKCELAHEFHPAMVWAGLAGQKSCSPEPPQCSARGEEEPPTSPSSKANSSTHLSDNQHHWVGLACQI